MSTEQNPSLGTEFTDRGRDSQTSGRKGNKSGSGTSTGQISAQETEYRQAMNHKPATEGRYRVMENITARTSYWSNPFKGRARFFPHCDANATSCFKNEDDRGTNESAKPNMGMKQWFTEKIQDM